MARHLQCNKCKRKFIWAPNVWMVAKCPYWGNGGPIPPKPPRGGGQPQQLAA